MNLKVYVCLMIYLAAETTLQWASWLRGKMEAMLMPEILDENPMWIKETINSFQNEFLNNLRNGKI